MPTAAVRDAIERYLRSHPRASDSVEGVRRWWLAAEGIDAPSSVVEAALTMLVVEGVVERRELPDGTIVYSARAEDSP